MAPQRARRKQTGFTVFEIAIVAIVAGLLFSGVIKASDWLRAAAAQESDGTVVSEVHSDCR